MRYLLNFADEKYRRAQQVNTWTSKYIAGFDRVIEFSPDSIDADFRSEHNRIFKYKRGAGLWIWKPYLISKMLEQVEEGDIVFYLDSGAFWVKCAKPIFRIIEKENYYISVVPLKEKQFTKRNVFTELNCMGDCYLNTNQVQSTMLGFKKTTGTVLFVKEWLKLCENIELLAPDLIPDGVDESFYAHREDQSLLSLLCKKREIPVHLDPTQYGRLPEKYARDGVDIVTYWNNKEYSPMIALHRSGNLSFRTCLNQVFGCFLPRKVSLWLIHKKGGC